MARDHLTRLAEMTTLWRCEVVRKDATPPYDVHPPIELRALTEGLAVDQLHWLRPDLTVTAVERRSTV